MKNLKIFLFLILFLISSKLICFSELKASDIAVIQESVAKKLPLYKVTEHFLFFCEPLDTIVADDMSMLCEEYFKQISIDFDNYIYNKKIIFEIYPNITEFHNAIGWSDAPNWICSGREEKDDLFVCRFVSPNNPGSTHLADFIKKLFFLDMIDAFTDAKFKNSSPDWLRVGLGHYKSGAFYESWEQNLIKDITKIPTFEQIKKCDDEIEFGKINGWAFSYSLVKFIDKKWGWGKIKQLLADYKSIESILGVSEEKLRTEWIEYLVKGGL